MKNKHKLAIQELHTLLVKLGGRVFAEYALRMTDDDEVKKSLKASDMLSGLMSGNLDKEWKLEETQDYKDLCEVANTINYLSKK